MTDPDDGQPRNAAPPGPPVVIAHLSDLHLGAHLPTMVDSLVADVTAARPTVTVVTGDFTMRARRVQFAQAAILLRRLPSPRLVVLGNHDVPLDSPARLWAPYERYRRQIEADLEPVVELPGLRALGLNSMPRWRWKSGRVSRRQVARVREVLGRTPPAAARVLAVHHPVSPQALRSRVVGRDRLLPALAGARVDLVLSGHTHLPVVRRLEVADADTGRTGHVLEVVAGTACSGRDRGAGRSWSLIHLDADTISVQPRYHFATGWRIGPTHTFPRQG